MIMFIMLVLPISVFFITQRDVRVAELRNLATDTLYPTPLACGNGDFCSGTGCSVPASLYGNGCFVSYYRCPGGSLSSGQSCDNLTGAVVTREGLRSASFQNCGIEQIDATCAVCGVTSNHDRGVNFISQTSSGSCGGGNESTPTPTSGTQSTPTPTTPLTGKCTDIKLYKNGQQITDPVNELSPGDAIKIAVKGSNSPSKAHFRVNGKELVTPDNDTDPNWTESSAKNSSGEFVADYTLPEDITAFQIEGEVFVDGVWK
jgi:hypothetical protein